MQAGEIYLAQFPFGDVPGMKLRPVLLLTGPVGPVPEILVSYISSVIPPQVLASDIVVDPSKPGFGWIYDNVGGENLGRDHRRNVRNQNFRNRTNGTGQQQHRSKLHPGNIAKGELSQVDLTGLHLSAAHRRECKDPAANPANRRPTRSRGLPSMWHRPRLPLRAERSAARG